MTVMYDNLARALRNQRNTLFAVCKEQGIDPKLVNPEKLSVSPCDWCATWQKNTQLTDEEGTLYCKVCLDAEYFNF